MCKPIKFSRQELERLSCSEEEKAIALKYQRQYYLKTIITQNFVSISKIFILN